MIRASHIVNAFIDGQVKGGVLSLRCKDSRTECEVFFDILDGNSTTGIVGIRGQAPRGFPKLGRTMGDVLSWAKVGMDRQIYHPTREWISKPSLNDFYYLQLRAARLQND